MHGFSDDERERIREELIEVGSELLLTYGPKKTTVADITDPIGIAKSTFYLFFDSKAELYFEILRRETLAFRERITEELDGVTDPRVGLERLFRSYIEFAEGNPLVQEVVIQGNYRETFRTSIAPDAWAKMQQEGVADYVPFVEALQEQSDGPLASYDPTVVLGVMGTLGLLVLHRDEYEEYGEGYYETVREALIVALARGLTVADDPRSSE
ncbi:TetR/AcrR family transcriptional regulator (plasmid) [Haloferacaceae archaeon DSL9]